MAPFMWIGDLAACESPVSELEVAYQKKRKKNQVEYQ